MKTPVKCPVCGGGLPELETKTATVCRRCKVVVDNFPEEAPAKAIYPPVGYEIPPAGVDVIAGDIHYCLTYERWDRDYPIHEERITTDDYPLIARPAPKREPGSGEQLSLF
jgi:hypothetical protein